MEMQKALWSKVTVNPADRSETDLHSITGSYWNRYYGEAKEISKRIEPSDFCRYCIESVFQQEHRNVVDLGCGNGRDSVFLAQNGFSVIAVDQSFAALQLLANHAERQKVSLKIEHGNFSHFLSLVPTNAYSRFSLHAIDTPAQKTLFHNVRRMVCCERVFAIEARTTQDVDATAKAHRESWDGDHYRRYLHVPTLLNELEKAGFDIQSVTQGRDFAPLPGVENPHVVRIVAK